MKKDRRRDRKGRRSQESFRQEEERGYSSSDRGTFSPDLQNQNAGERIKKPRRFTIKMQKKLAVLFGLVVVAFIALCIRMVYIYQEKGDTYAKQVLAQQGYDSQTIPYKRGDIVDANGIVLATSEKVYNLITDSTIMLYNKDSDGNYVNLDATVEALATYFDLDADTVRTYVTEHTTSAYKVWLKQLTYDEIEEFQEAMNASGSLIKGVWFEEEYKRIYPFGSLAADVIGFVGSDNTGNYGLEEYYNDVLNGTNGREYGYLNSDSTLEVKVKAAEDGYTIHSTIDVTIQQIVEKYLQEFMDEYADNYREGNGAENVACIIMEVDTGNILAMASLPGYDLNDYTDYSALLGANLVEEVENANGYTEIQVTDTVITQTLLDSLTDSTLDEETQTENLNLLYVNLNYLWKNFCISNTYEPGSTFKPFVVAAALDSGSITGNEVYTCNGVLTRGGYAIKCHGGNGHGAVTVQNAVAWSCNMALIQIAEAMGNETFLEYQSIFNFGLRTNIDLAGEARTASLVNTLETLENDGSALAINSFGQGFNVTMIQMITGYSALINGGYYYEPHMVSKITNSSGATVETIEPRVLRQVISESTSEKILSYTRATVMEEGGSNRTGKTARPAGYAIGGKTGTAQTLPRGNGEYVVSFIGHAPADDPEIAIYVVVDRANAETQADAKYATRIVRNILTEVLPYLGIYMTEELTEEEEEELAALDLENTLKYTQTVEDEDLEDESAGSGEEGEETESAWESYPLDEATGYLINPETGDYVDPETGEIVDPETGEVLDDTYEALPEGLDNVATGEEDESNPME